MEERHDFAKPRAWREETLSVIKRSRLFRGQKIDCSYIEMFGISGFEMFEMMEPLLVDPACFLGVDSDPVVTYLNRVRAERECLGLQTPLGDFYDYCVKAADAAFMSPLPAVGIFNVDETRQISHADWWGSSGKRVVTSIGRALRHHEEVVLILNGSLDRNAVASQQLVDLSREVFAAFAGWRTDRTRFLGKDFREAQRVDDRKVGQTSPEYVGAFQIYRSGKPHVIRMATLRLRFTKTEMCPGRPKSPSGG